MRKNTILLLHNLRSAYNVGSIFRTADAAGVSKIYLTGVTPAPVDRFGRKQKEISKTALGAENTVVWEQKARIIPLLGKLKKDGVQIIGVEQSPKALDYRKIRVSSPAAFVFGNEVSGLPENVLAQCDVIAEIPMHPHHSSSCALRVSPKAKQRHEWCGCVRGKKESLNVAVAAGVVLFR